MGELLGVAGDLVWLDWTLDGRELVASSDDGEMTRWSWTTAQPIHAIGVEVFAWPGRYIYADAQRTRCPD